MDNIGKTILSNGRQINKHKIVNLTLGGIPWMEALNPAGKGVPDTDYFAENLDTALCLDSGVSLTATTTYSTPIGDLFNKFMDSTPGKALSAVTMGSTILNESADAFSKSDAKSALQGLAILPSNVRYQTKLMKLPAWENTDATGISSLTFEFNFGMAGEYDGRTEVYNPVIALARVNLPTQGGALTLKGPIENAATVYGEMTKEALSTMFNFSGDIEKGNFDFEAKLSQAIGSLEQNLYSRTINKPGIAEIRVGKVLYPPFTVGNTSYEFSTDTDENGYPIWGKVTWDNLASIQVAVKGEGAYILHKPGYTGA